MNGRALAVVIGAAALVGGAAFMLSRGERVEQQGDEHPLLATLKADVGTIAAVELLRGDERIRLEKSGEAWTLASSGGYPAKVDAIRGVIGGLASMTIDETLTSKRERHAELGLAWPDTSKQAMLVRLLGAEDRTLYEIVLGEEKFEPKSQYSRKLNEDQTYRCRGSVTADTTPRSFVDAEIIKVDAAELESINFDGLLLTRGEDGTWKAELVPGAVAESAWPEEQRKAATQALPTWIGRVDLEDVRKRDRDGAAWAADPGLTMIYFAKRATISVEGMKDGEAMWVRLSATAIAETAAPPKEGETAKPTEAPFDWEAWNTRMASWEFKLPEWKKSAITRIREAKPAAAAGAG